MRQERSRPAPACTVPELLAVRADAEPAKPAIEMAGQRAMTFEEWNQQANGVALELLLRGAKRGDRVGLVFADDQWIEFAIAYCGTQRAGAAAVPLSDRLPLARLRTMLDDCGASAVVHAGHLCEGHCAGRWSFGVHDVAPATAGPASNVVGPEDLAQVVYTSGTTGAPKGVAATHANLTFGFDLSTPRHRPLAHSRHFLHAFPIGSNAGQTMLVNALTAAPTALVAGRFDPDSFAALIECHRVGTVFVVPSMAVALLNERVHDRFDLSSVVLLGSTGSALPPAVASALTELFPSATVVNYYTSTEAAPAQLTMVFDPSRAGSVGLAAEPGDVMVADPAGHPVGPGEAGAVLLRSRARPRAYYGDQQSTDDVFTGGWVRMGDVGYLDADGYLHLIDRDRDLIKTGAFKVSTLAVEAALHEHPAVADVAVVGLPHPVMGMMVGAAVVIRSPVVLPELRAFLKDRLAPHEMPSRLMVVESLPRSEAGKVIKQEVRATFDSAAAAASQSPAPGTEAALARMWCAVLGAGSIGRNDDFFARGGDSLRAAQLATLVSDELGVDMPAGLVFDLPGLAEQAEWVDSAAASATGSIVSTNRVVTPSANAPGDGRAPLTAMAEDFLRCMYRTKPAQPPSPVALELTIKDKFDVDLMRRALEEIARRHEALQIAFDVDDDEMDVGETDGLQGVARFVPDRPPEVAEVDAVGHSTDDRLRHVAALADAQRSRPFDLKNDPLVRALVIHVDERLHVLVLVVQHLVFDGWSTGVLLRELGEVYAGMRDGRAHRLPVLPLTYTEYCAWTRSQWPRTTAFWQQVLAGAPGALDRFPERLPTGQVDLREYQVDVADDVAAGLRTLARTQRASSFMAVAACWATVLSAWSGSSDIGLISPVPGRTRPEHETLIGCLFQDLLLRIDTSGNPTFRELLTRVRTTALDAIDHQFRPHAEFRPRVADWPGLSYTSWDGPIRLPQLMSEPFAINSPAPTYVVPPGHVDRRVPLLRVNESAAGRLSGSLVWNRHAFHQHTVQALAESFLLVARRAALDPEARPLDSAEPWL